MIIPVAVEKLAHLEFEKIGSRQEALQTIFPSLLDIFYHPIFDFFQKNRLFQQPPLFSTVIGKLGQVRTRCLIPPSIVGVKFPTTELSKESAVWHRYRLQKPKAQGREFLEHQPQG